MKPDHFVKLTNCCSICEYKETDYEKKNYRCILHNFVIDSLTLVDCSCNDFVESE
jgi:hypothetical protein